MVFADGSGPCAESQELALQNTEPCGASRLFFWAWSGGSVFLDMSKQGGGPAPHSSVFDACHPLCFFVQREV